MDTTILDTLKQINLPIRNFNLFSEASVNELKNHLLKININDESLFLKQLTKDRLINKLNNFEFSNSISNIKIIELTKKDINKENFNIYYHIYDTQFGSILIASTNIGVCYLAFETIEKPSLPYLKEIFSQANFINQVNKFDELVLNSLNNIQNNIEIPVHIKGTSFQIEVWKALLQIPIGSLTSYGEIAKKINKPKAFRAVGTAIGNNPISFFIPCHRVIQSNGNFGGYMWGLPTKFLLIGYEGSFNQ